MWPTAAHSARHTVHRWCQSCRMPAVDDLQLPVDTGGAVFSLTEPAPATATLGIDGWVTTLSAGSTLVHVAGSGARDHACVLPGALDAADRALDLLCYRGGPALSVAHAFDDHVVWWPGADGLQVVVTATQPRRFNTTATLTVRDASGSIVPPPTPPPPQWDESLRHFRYSQTASTLADSYRHLWLAVESLLDVVLPHPAAGGESTWVTAAFDAAESMGVPVSSRIPSHVNGATTGERAYHYFYSSRRNLLFHAKRSRRPMSRETEPVRRELHDALSGLAPLFADLAATLTGEQRRTGGMTYSGFDLLCDGIADDGAIHLLAGDADVDEPSTAAITTAAVWSGAVRVPGTLRYPGLVTFVASGAAIPSPFQTLVLTRTRGPVAGADFAGPIDLTDAARTELRLRHRLVSNSARDRFAG